MFLTPEQTGGPGIFSLRQHNRYLVVWHYGLAVPTDIRAFDIEQLAQALGQNAGGTWQEHASLIKLACMGGKLFEWLDTTGGP